MKLPRRSLAYGWARMQLHRPPSKFAVPIGIGAALVLFALAAWNKVHAWQLGAAGVAFLIGALDAWQQRGFCEVFQEQERLLDEVRDRQGR